MFRNKGFYYFFFQTLKTQKHGFFLKTLENGKNEDFFLLQTWKTKKQEFYFLQTSES